MLMCACGSALVCGLSLIWGRVVAPLDVLTDTRRVVGFSSIAFRRTKREGDGG